MTNAHADTARMIVTFLPVEARERQKCESVLALLPSGSRNCGERASASQKKLIKHETFLVSTSSLRSNRRLHDSSGTTAFASRIIFGMHRPLIVGCGAKRN
jgi:hypothetical protein